MADDTNEKWNFSALLGQGTFVDVGYQLTSPKLVLPFLYMALGAPVLFAGLILPVVQVSNLISQLASAPILGGRGLRKWYMMLAMITSALALSIVAIGSRDSESEWLVALFLVAAIMIGISQGVSTLAFQDLIARVLSHHGRSRLLFTQVALAGIFTVVIAYGSQQYFYHENSIDEHLELLWIGIAVTVFAAVMVALVRETPPTGAAHHAHTLPANEDDHGIVQDFFKQLVSALKIGWFRRFLTARTLFLSIEMAMPFYALHAATLHAENHRSLSTFVIASSLGLFAGGMLWQRVARVSTGAVMWLACAVAAGGGGLAVAMDMVAELRNPWLHGVVFLLVATANEGTRNARKIYLTDFATDEERPLYVALSNVVIGAIGALVAFVFGALAHLQDVVWPVWCIIGLNVLAGLYARQLATARAPAAA